MSSLTSSELNDEVAGEVLRLDLAPFLAPKPQQSGFIDTHDGPGVRAADEEAATGIKNDLCLGLMSGCHHPPIWTEIDPYECIDLVLEVTLNPSRGQLW